MREISKKLKEHYRDCFSKHGPTSKGVDWGDKDWAADIRQYKMLEVVQQQRTNSISILDVGCGYGSLADVIRKENLNIEYTGIDIVSEMIDCAKERHSSFQFLSGDIFSLDGCKYDYVVCNGVITQKLDSSTLLMNQYAQDLIKKMFDLCRVGIAFNIMNTHVTFQNDNLYHRNPAEMLGWCMSELTPRAKLDCAYKLWYEYTVYLYKETG